MAKAAPRLDRKTFVMSRELEYFSEQELRMQIGCAPYNWPLALTKELIDNALDACEGDSTVSPMITVTINGDQITVTDNGPGLPQSTLESSLDYSTRTSDKNLYIAPTRGQLGNALKCLWSGPFVYSGLSSGGDDEHATLEIVTAKYAYQVNVTVDKIAGKPKIDLLPLDVPLVKTGTSIKTAWLHEARFNDEENPDSYKSNDDDDEEKPDLGEDRPRTLHGDVRNLLESYATFNPHASFRLCLDGETVEIGTAIVTGWEKWLTSDHTCPHWYSAEDLRNLIAAYITNGEGTKTVREFVSEFRGLTSPVKQKAVVEKAKLTGQRLSDFVAAGSIDLGKVTMLLEAMCNASKPVKAEKLGVIGEEALTKRMIEIDGIAPESARYSKVADKEVANPAMVEVLFGLRPEGQGKTYIRFGLNFAPTLELPVRWISSWLNYDRLIEQDDATCLTIHATCPRLPYASRAKGSLVD